MPQFDSKKFDLVIKNGTIITANATYKADIGIIGEHISAIGQDLLGIKEIDATDKLVLPGAIDVHVHMQMPLRDNIISADDFFTGSRAAAYGGTTTIIDFVAAEAKQPLIEALMARRAEADDRVVIDYGLHMTITPTDIPKLNQLPAVIKAGCTSFKLYMAYGFYLTDGELLQALKAVGDAGGLAVIHAENWEVICTLISHNLAQGHTSPHWHPRCRPAIMEGEAAGRVIDIATLVGVPVHIFHVSCAEVVKRIATARSQGLAVYGETCPQYLLLTDDLYDQPGITGTLPVCAPPLRTKTDQTRLWQALARNELQLVSTDHCPFTKIHKAEGLEDFSLIPGGVPSIEGRLAMIYTFGVQAGHISLNRWVDICATTPAKLFGLSNKGTIAIGYDADLVIFNPHHPIKLTTDTLHENVDWTPYDGFELTGWPELTISRGKIIIQNGQCVVNPGQGQFIKRELYQD